jgi:acetylornithine deacetylase/succinyl-diaminopimelate desuccinylase-like protein
MYTEIIETYIQENYTATLKLLRTLCGIPAPSNKEEARADFCKAWLESIGVDGVYIDDAKNVIFPMNCEGS